MSARPAHARPGRLAARGFAMLEALAALAVVAFTLLALAAGNLQVQQADERARQRGEAALLAQQQVESLRGYTSISGAAPSWNGMAAGSDTVAGGNTSFSRSWTVGGSATDPMRPVQVALRWSDRGGSTQTLSLATVIARSDPVDVGSLGFPLPDNTTLKRPMNRNLNIPLPAVDIGQGESAFRLPATTFVIVFSNDSGYVIRSCTTAANLPLTRDNLTSCTQTSAYLLAGYVSLDAAKGNKAPSFPSGLAVNTSQLSGTSSINCSLGDATLNTNAATTIAGYKYYLCVISVPTTGAAWNGTVRLAAPSLAAGGSGALNVCRFEYPPATGVSANQRNVQPYVDVRESIDSQNYLLTSSNTCPTGTVLHQNCGTAGACPG